MTFSRIAVAVGIALLTVFAIAVYVGGPYGLRSVMIVLVTMAALIGAGNLLYGRRSHYAAVQERTRPGARSARPGRRPGRRRTPGHRRRGAPG